MPSKSVKKMNRGLLNGVFIARRSRMSAMLWNLEVSDAMERLMKLL